MTDRISDERLAQLLRDMTQWIERGYGEDDVLAALRELQSLRAKVAELEAEVALRAAGEQP